MIGISFAFVALFSVSSGSGTSEVTPFSILTKLLFTAFFVSDSISELTVAFDFYETL